MLVMADGPATPVDIGLPGQFNRANAAMVAVAAAGWPATDSGDGPRAVGGHRPRPAGRAPRGGRAVLAVDTPRASGPAAAGQEPGRMDGHLRPAGRVGPPGPPVVLSINARIADGLDTSWLWDVPFERLAGRTVVATGDRGSTWPCACATPRSTMHGGGRPAGRGRPGSRCGWPAPSSGRGPRRRSTSSATTPPSPSCGAGCERPADRLGADRRRGLPRPPRHLRRRGNGLVLARRASWRGVDVELIQAASGRPLPRADLYCIGGGEDGPAGPGGRRALAPTAPCRGRRPSGAVVLGVCAGFQLLGAPFPDGADRPHEASGCST